MAETERENIREATHEVSTLPPQGPPRRPAPGHHRPHAPHRAPPPRQQDRDVPGPELSTRLAPFARTGKENLGEVCRKPRFAISALCPRPGGVTDMSLDRHDADARADATLIARAQEAMVTIRTLQWKGRKQRRHHRLPAHLKPALRMPSRLQTRTAGSMICAGAYPGAEWPVANGYVRDRYSGADGDQRRIARAPREPTSGGATPTER